jgi:hypothetical protein
VSRIEGLSHGKCRQDLCGSYVWTQWRGPGKQTAFTYDGLGRRRTIASTPPGGGSATTTAYLWCGDDICQARDGTNTPIRSYYAEGEYVPGTPASLYYGIDQIGSVRRVFASPMSAPAYGYDPYGVPLQVSTFLSWAASGRR